MASYVPVDGCLENTDVDLRGSPLGGKIEFRRITPPTKKLRVFSSTTYRENGVRVPPIARIREQHQYVVQSLEKSALGG